jgi:hypothetical protein
MALMPYIVKCLMALCVVSMAVYPQPNPSEKPIPPDSTLAKNEVISFCKFWQAQQLDSMRAMLGKDTKADSLFLKTYGMNGKGPGKVVKFSIVDVAKDEKGVKVRVKLTFKKQARSHGVNGVHGVYLEEENGPVLRSPDSFKDGGGKWKIMMIVAPIGPPVEGRGGERPGE